MTTRTVQTPNPFVWPLHVEYDEDAAHVIDAKGEAIVEGLDSAAKAEYLVYAVNCHYELLEALKALQHASARLCEAAWHDTEPSAIQEWTSARKGLDNIIQVALQAIAKAEGMG